MLAISRFVKAVEEWFEGSGEMKPAQLAVVLGRAHAEDLCLSICTRTRVDAGSWFGKKRVWAFVFEDRLFLYARGLKPFQFTIPHGELRESLYNHVTGEVVLAPFKDDRIRGLRVSPLDGAGMLELFKTKK